VAELVAYLVQGRAVEVDPLGARQEQSEGHSLCVPIGERGVVGLREEQGAPVPCEAGERLVVLVGTIGNCATLDHELIQHLAAQ